MRTRNLVVAIILVIAVVALIFAFTQPGSAPVNSPSTGQVQTSTQAGNESPGNAQNQEQVVAYTDNGFSPNSLTVSSGQSVTFFNASNRNFWVASDPHPVHTDYPGFDAKRQIPPGESYTFTFQKVGTWGYHNHMNPAQKGVIIVK